MVKETDLTALIIVPHIDDEVFGCWSILTDERFKEVVVLQLTVNDHQNQREKAYLELRHLVPNVRIDKSICKSVDGKLGELPATNKELITDIDTYLRDNHFDYIFIPGESHHQDHIAANKVCKAAIRPRSSLNVEGIFEYTYMYHDNLERNSVFSVMTKEQVQNRTEFLNKMNELDGILDNTSVNSIEILNSLSRISGAFVNKPYADRFIPVRLIL